MQKNRGMGFARSPRCKQRRKTNAKLAIKGFLRKEHFMTRIHVLASVLYSKSVGLKTRNFNKLIWNNNRNKSVSSLSAMQFLVASIGSKNISHTQAGEIISVLHDIIKCQRSCCHFGRNRNYCKQIVS